MKTVKVFICVFLMSLILGGISGCNNKPETVSKSSASLSSQKGHQTLKSTSIYPHQTNSWAGDPIPYYTNGTFQIFYLDDLRDGAVGYHPWSLYQTKDFVTFQDRGIVIPYSRDTSAQDNALGTGSVIQDSNGVYHAFYTGHNDELALKETVMEAVSTDLVHWQKQTGWALRPGTEYSEKDFRDPAVLYIKAQKEYWMLVTTRSQGKAVLARYKSKNLKDWKDAGVFFTSDMGDGNMECPTLVQFGDWWYLTFSDQSPNRVVHYRKSKSPEGPFVKPECDSFDGNGFYAGKTVTNDKGLYLCGWIPTRRNYNDNSPYDWAGSLAVHQLVPNKDGVLTVTPPNSVAQDLNKPSQIQITHLGPGATSQNGEFTFKNPGSWISFQPWDKKTSVKITGVFKSEKAASTFGLTLPMEDDGKYDFHYQIDLRKGIVSFFNPSDPDTMPESTVRATFSNKKSIPFTFLVNDSACVLYIGGSALSARIFTMPGANWGIWSNDTDLKVQNLQAFTGE